MKQTVKIQNEPIRNSGLEPETCTDGETARGASADRRTVLKGAITGGIAAILSRLPLPAVASVKPEPKLAKTGPVREYWISADAFLHNLVPNGHDSMMNVSYTPDQSSYMALGYRAYTRNWGEPLPGNQNIGPNTGIPGPVIRAHVGETIIVHFRNNDTHYRFPHSIHPHGVRYGPESDGAWRGIDPNKPGTAVKPGDTYTYIYAAEPDSVGTWPYHDHSVPQAIGQAAPDPELGAQLGLFGMLAITDAETSRVDRENILVLHDIYCANVPGLVQDFACFNGLAFAENTPVFHARIRDRVRWRIMSLGTEMHVFHLHGHRWLYDGRNVDSLVIGPGTTLTFDYVEDNPGKWLYHCHLTSHMMQGMAGQYIVV